MNITNPFNRIIDIGIITIIPSEIKALFSWLNIDADSSENIDSPLDYWKTSYYSEQSNRDLSIVISIVSGEAGNVDSSISTISFLRDWHPKLMCLVGIAAGVSGKIKIADVVIPNKVHDRLIKVYKNAKYSVRGSTHNRPNLLTKMLKLNPICQNDFVLKCRANAGYELEKFISIAKGKRLNKNEYSEIQEIYDGSIVSDNILIRDPTYFEPLLKDVDEKIRCGEMEACGFVSACQNERIDFPWIIVRGISDFGDNRKDDIFQLLAAKNACSALILFIEKTLNINNLPDNPRTRTVLSTLEFNMIHQMKRAFDSKRWEEVCRIGSTLSRPLWLAGHYKLRIELGRLVESASAYINKTSLRSRILIDDLGWTQYEIGKEEEALKSILDGIRIAKECNDYYTISKGYRHLASINRQHNNLSEAQTMLSKSKENADKIDEESYKQEMLSSLLVSEGKLLMAQKKFKKASQFLKTALANFVQNGDLEREVKIYSLLGKAEQECEHFKKAKEFFIMGREKAKNLGRFDELSSNTTFLLNIIGDTDGEQSKRLKTDVYNFAISNGLWSEAKKWNSG